MKIKLTWKKYKDMTNVELEQNLKFSNYMSYLLMGSLIFIVLSVFVRSNFFNAKTDLGFLLGVVSLLFCAIITQVFEVVCIKFELRIRKMEQDFIGRKGNE